MGTKQNSWLYNESGELRVFRMAMLIALMASLIVGFFAFAFGYQIDTFVLAENSEVEDCILEEAESGLGKIYMGRYSPDAEFKSFCEFRVADNGHWRSIEQTQLILCEELGYGYLPLYREDKDSVTFYMLNGALVLPKNDNGLVVDTYIGLNYEKWCTTDCSMPEGVECIIPGGFLNHWDFRNSLRFVDAEGMNEISEASIPILASLYLDGQIMVERNEDNVSVTATLENFTIKSELRIWKDEIDVNALAKAIYNFSLFQNINYFGELPEMRIVDWSFSLLETF